MATESRFAAAFASIEHVHRCMSAHDASSDLARIVRSAHRRPVVVDRHTHAVLELAQELARATRGRFDVTLAAQRTRDAGRPLRAARRRESKLGMQALHLERRSRVCTDIALGVDLSGIAKGYAVDCAVDAMRGAGAAAGLVNAGGDLRVFGQGVWMPVRVRLLQRATLTLPLFEVQEAAAATSADYFRDDAAALFDPHRRHTRSFAGSISVVAPTCALADALTKVVALMPARAVRLLAHYGAHAFRLDPQRNDCVTTLRAATPRLRFGASLVV